MIPEELSYTKDHEWVRLEEGVATIGISHAPGTRKTVMSFSSAP